jgi:hypothetical protein
MLRLECEKESGLNQVRQHVLVWVAPQFLQSAGMSRILREAEFFSLTDEEWDAFVKSAELAGGFALSGMLAEPNHGAGIWMSPVTMPGLELMVPWAFVRGVVTAKDPESSKMFGLMTELGQRPAVANGDGPAQGA